MALTQNQVDTLGRLLAKDAYNDGVGQVVPVDYDDLKAAISSIDTAMETVINSIPPAWGNKTIKQALIDNLPNAFRNNSTTTQKAIALSLWALGETR